jgi:5-methylthioadenosine/S-adenosylhomocysteine deaminase
MEPVDTLVRARWVIPIEPDGRVLHDHAVAIRDGRVVAVAPAEEAGRRFDARESVDRPHHVLLPGLVNSHTHAALVLRRGRADNLPLDRWLRSASWPHERGAADPEFVRDGTELAIAEMLRAGITCFADMQVWPDVVARAAAAAHVRVSVGLVVSEIASNRAASADEYIDRGMHLRDQYRGDPLITTHFAVPAPAAATDATLSRVRRLADELDMPVAMPLHESALEIEHSLRDFGQRPIERLSGLGLVSPQLVAIHMTQAEPRDIDLLAGSGASVVHCPESNLRLAAGVCPVARLLARGVRVSLGTDGATANNDLDLLAEARVAGLLSAGVAATPGDLVAGDLLRMATLEGARALGLGEVTGSLLPGKWADLCCINLRAARSWPVHDVAMAVIFAASSQQVTDTWVAGRRLLADSRLALLDESAALDRAESWRELLDADLDRETRADD